MLDWKRVARTTLEHLTDLFRCENSRFFSVIAKFADSVTRIPVDVFTEVGFAHHRLHRVDDLIDGVDLLSAGLLKQSLSQIEHVSTFDEQDGNIGERIFHCILIEPPARLLVMHYAADIPFASKTLRPRTPTFDKEGFCILPESLPAYLLVYGVWIVETIEKYSDFLPGFLLGIPVGVAPFP